ncbi:amidohydrolase [Pseudogemmobacter humi]|uniref:N-substituted formamide deformylase n=1 Tax=Pseudogemmobacter humi TaxID=2483812 RepID=A0A3P5WHX5_9RHOB|nr:amidohydrolase [Pseudogemmobacter humi]VDC21278.1 N-substituted formamide deformylase precursor [Pseudogemmobacter humi]
MSATILTNARIRTMDPVRPRAGALLIRDGRIAALGTTEEIAALAPKGAKRIDAHGALVLPGFQDAHIHLLSGGTDLATAAPLYEAVNLADLLSRVAAHATRTPDLPLILGAGWQPGIFTDADLTAEAIDPATGGRPAVLYDSSFHNACLNTAALTMAGIGPGTSDPPNGHIVRYPSGRPTGMLHEEAIPMALSRLPHLSDAHHLQGLRAGQAHANAHGITGVLDPCITDLEARIYAMAVARGDLTLRVTGAARIAPQDTPETALARLTALRAAHPGPDFHVQSAKFFMDGVFENRTAACHAPYADAQGGNAPCMFSQDQTVALMTALDAARFQIHAHVIGDAALTRVLDGLEAARAANGAWPAAHQLAHLQLTAPGDFAHLAALGMANIQPLWARYDPKIPDIALDMIGPERLLLTYAFRRMLDQGAGFCLSSDWPVSTLNPFEIIETAITRQARQAETPGPPFLPDEALTVAECVEGYTAQAARACWRETFTGRLSPGFSADLILLDQDIFACPTTKISDTKVLLTLFKGQPVHSA